MLYKITTSLVLGFVSLFSFAQADLAINSNISSPADGCYLSTTETVTVILGNTGGGTYSGTLEMGYILNNGSPVIHTETITGFTVSGTYIYSFPTTGDFSSCQVHDLTVWVYDTNDPNNWNDTINVQVISDCAPVVGSVSGPDTVCYNINSGTLQLNGYVGNVYSWESSIDNGSTWGATVTPYDTLPFNNLTNETLVRVIVESQWGFCPNDTTGTHEIAIQSQSNAGSLPADFDICDNGNAGDIVTTGYTGNVLGWMQSQDGGTTWNPLPNTDNDTVSYSSLTTNTLYQVVVKNGVCPADTSAPVTLTLIPGSAPGTITGESVVCNFENDSSLLASGGNGSVVGWNVSIDSGATWLGTLQDSNVYYYTGLQNSTLFEALWQVGNCPTASAYHYIKVLPADLGITQGDTTIVDGSSIQLNAYGGVSYEWSPNDFIDDITVSDPIVSPEYDITYYVEVTDLDGCTDTANINITVVPDVTDLNIPNLFTPNGDGYNDTWEIINLDIFVDNELIIFNAYGQPIYEAAPYQNDWAGEYNGQSLPDGTYFYILTLNDPLYPDPLQGVITIAGND